MMALGLMPSFLHTVRITPSIRPIKKAMTPLYTTGNEDRAGLGFTVMQSFCDRVSVKSKREKGTSVTLTKKIKGRSKW